MSFQEELYYKIEAYLSGELDAGETAAFENQISTDDLLNAAVEKHKVANALIVEQRLMSVKNILQEEQLKGSNTNTPFKPFGFILIAAVTVGIGASVWMLTKDDTVAASTRDIDTHQEIVAETGKTKSLVENKESVLQDASKYNVVSEDAGFHKQQIQQIEEHLHTDDKGVLYIDSSFLAKKADVKTNTNISSAPNTPITSDKINTPAAPCATVSIQATINTTASCIHAATGNIIVQNIHGGVKPYAVSILDSHHESVVNGALVAGMYQIYIIDANTCGGVYSSAQITEKECSRDYSFNPFLGEKWSLDTYGSSGQLEIYNKGGVLYYQAHVESQNEIEWTGIGTSNQIIPGYYIFVMKYADGTVQKGSVTIVQ